MTTLQTILAELTDLGERAIPAPWSNNQGTSADYQEVQGPSRSKAPLESEYDYQVIAQLSIDDCVNRREAKATADLICALRNALPRLSTLAREQDAELERLREALRRVSGMCAVSGQCRCGRPNGIPAVKHAADSALAATRAQGEKTSERPR